MIRIISVLDEFSMALEQASLTLKSSPPMLLDQLHSYLGFLKKSNGSQIPDGTPELISSVLKSSMVFYVEDSETPLDSDLMNRDELHLQRIGEGAYATVFKVRFEGDAMPFALKRAKPDISEEDLVRFKNEYKTMRALDSPFITSVYRYYEARNEYLMEFIPQTLSDFMRRKNAQLKFNDRKKLVLQFLRALHYIHSKHLLHRDLSYTNVLIKEFGDGVRQIKISDFGLVKNSDLNLTRTMESMKGSLLDPALSAYKDYSLVNEIYSIGMIMNKIFTGKNSQDNANPASPIIRKATTQNLDERYDSLIPIFQAVQQLHVE
ncbi:protein kinase family protein [Bifidobacterium crudilactis]|jgi:serine/threonine protein kinase|uniref:protein kinase family protein n=1 Tax=Bifidobacterium crudilactis TaxID=327277 RepID=UPI002F354A49